MYAIKNLGMGVKVISGMPFSDKRGVMTSVYDKKEFKSMGIKDNFTEQLISESKSLVLRGMHFQKFPYSQAKFIQCISGEIFIAAIDVRGKSKTFGRYASAILSHSNKKCIYVPRGFAVGFEVLSKENAIVYYNISGKHIPNSTRGIIWNSNSVGITWPKKPKIISEKDLGWPDLNDVDV
jgi:dTDP-4-dehydrorhamnose 3,5-epimerase